MPAPLPYEGDWWSITALLGLNCPELPKTPQGLKKLATRAGWQSRQLPGQGAPVGYHYASLPPAVRQVIAERSVAARPITLDLFEPLPAKAGVKKTDANLAALTGGRLSRAEHRLALLAAFDGYRRAAGITELCKAARLFALAWNTRRIEADPALLDALPTVSRNSLLNWHAAREKRGAAALAGAWRGRREAGEIEGNAALRDLLLGIYAEKPHLTAGQYRDALRNNLAAGAALPKVHTINRFLRRWRDDNKRIDMKLRDPDRAKSKFAPAIGDAAAGIERTNQVWQLDASPADVMCRDGRHKLTVVIDVATRRALVLVTDQPRAIAHLALFRAFALRLGLPEKVKTDNGQDYRAVNFTATMAALGIEQEFCPPFSPERKPFIERFIGTLQRDLLATLPGFTGHNVAQAQQLRARKKFSERLGMSDDDAFSVNLTAAELQGAILAWLDDYHATKHSTLGCSPAERAAELGAGRRGTPDARELDICLMPLADNGGRRTVLRDGIRVEGATFIAEWIGARAGSDVIVRIDPVDMGRIHCFDPATHQYVGEALEPSRMGLARRDMALAARHGQQAVDQPVLAELRRIKRGLKPHRIADAIASGTPLLPSRLEVEFAAEQHPGLRHLEAMTVQALPAPEETAPEAAPQDAAPTVAPSAGAVPAREAEFVAWVLAGNGNAQHRRYVLQQARQSEVFCELYEISAEQLAALQGADVRAA